MVELNWHDYIVIISFIAGIAGLLLLGDNRNSGVADDSLRDSFAARTCSNSRYNISFGTIWALCHGSTD